MAEDADADDLYDDAVRAVPRLASVVELRASLESATAERQALEGTLAALQAENKAGREAIQDLTRRGRILLATARLELQRKDELLRRKIPSKRPHPAPSTHSQMALQQSQHESQDTDTKQPRRHDSEDRKQ